MCQRGRVSDATVALLAAAGVHAGFQLVVTVLVYPALADVPAERWATTHAAHSRRIAPLVGFVYASVAGACGWALVEAPEGWVAVTVSFEAAAVLVTAAFAAPLHGRLAAGPDPALLARLRAADRWRTALALAGLVAAAAAAS